MNNFCNIVFFIVMQIKVVVVGCFEIRKMSGSPRPFAMFIPYKPVVRITSNCSFVMMQDGPPMTHVSLKEN